MHEPAYVISLREVFCGIILMAMTLVMHGLGMILALRVSRSFSERFEQGPSLLAGLTTLILASSIITVVHCLEVIIWAAFFFFVTGGMPNTSTAYYYALLEYTTLGSSLNLPINWRLLEGLTAIAGVLTFAWSTSVFVTLAQGFQEWQLQILSARRKKRRDRAGTNA
jgi:hypothetical protein